MTNKETSEYCCGARTECNKACLNPDGCSQPRIGGPYECIQATTTVTSTTTSVTTTTCGNRNPYFPYNCLDVIPTAVPQYLDDDDFNCRVFNFACDEDDDDYGFNKGFQTWYIGPVFGGIMFCCFFAFFCCTVMKARGGNGAQGNGAQYAATRGVVMQPPGAGAASPYGVVADGGPPPGYPGGNNSSPYGI